MTNSSFVKIARFPRDHSVGRGIKIRGKFCVNPKADFLKVSGAEILKHIVLVVTRGGNYQTFNPFRKVVVFDDDVKMVGDNCSGFFNVDIFEHLKFSGGGDYYILCSLGAVQSNILNVTMPDGVSS